MIDDSEIVKFELQTAKKLWEALSVEDQNYLLSMPVTKEITAKSYGPNHLPPAVDRPEFGNLIRLGLVADCFTEDSHPYSSMGGLHTTKFYTPIYALVGLGIAVSRYGHAVRLLEMSAEKEN